MERLDQVGLPIFRIIADRTVRQYGPRHLAEIDVNMDGLKNEDEH